MKKFWITLLSVLMVCAVQAAAAEIALFPVQQTLEDGSSRWGYMDENGGMTVGFFYADAGLFDESGYAVVKTVGGQTAVINTAGDVVIDPADTPQRVEFGTDSVAFRYSGRTVYYTYDGEELGAYENAAGFFQNDLLRVQQDGLWGYVGPDGAWNIKPQYTKAGDFWLGSALVQDAEGNSLRLYQNGKTEVLPGRLADFTIYEERLAIIEEGGQYRLYALDQAGFATDAYQEISAFVDGYALVRQNGLWGIVNADGQETVEPSYYYLSYMGSGVFAGRGEDGAAVAITSAGIRVYYTQTYLNGFTSFRYGMSWHGRTDGGTMFFNHNGVFSRWVEGGTSPEIVSANVAALNIGGERQYIRLTDGAVLYAPTRNYQLGSGVSVQTKTYEKYLGTLADGSEYGWSLDYPQLSGMKNAEIQRKINTAIESFFLSGPSREAQRYALEGSYGFAQYGNVLVVYAEAVSGLGDDAVIWNESITLDLTTGQTYSIYDDLFTGDYTGALAAGLPEGVPTYLLTFPRVTDNAVIFYVNHPSEADRAPYSDMYTFYFQNIWEVIADGGPLYSALTAKEAPAARFADVPFVHWAHASVEEAAARGLMQGAGPSRFEPDSPATLAQAAVTFARALGLSEGTMPGVQGVWYEKEYGAMYEAGLLEGLEGENPDAGMGRSSAMVLLANVLRRESGERLDENTVARQLAAFSDREDIPAAHRESVAYCISRGLISGADGRLNPRAGMTRAEFAKILVGALPQ